MEKNRTIAIIGAGISGLMACKYTMEKGFSPIVFVAKSGIGGVWSQTVESTKLQTPKDFYQFSDFPWPSAVTETHPHHRQVLEYLQAYALHFKILPTIKFNSKVICIDYVTSCTENMLSRSLWGGSGQSFSPSGKWNVAVGCSMGPSAPTQVYQVDFVILCIGKYSDLPNIPDFPLNKGPEVFNGKVLHSMNYAAMDDTLAAAFIKEKRVTVIGFQKSAVDIAAQVASKNGASYPCTLLFKTIHLTVPEYLLRLFFHGMNRFTELMIHKPGEGFFLWLLAMLLSPLIWIFSTLIEFYLKGVYPLKKYKMVPAHRFFKQISSCMFTVLPANFYDRVKDGSLFLKKSQSFSFCENGLMVEGESRPLQSDIVIFATGYKGDEKLKNIFKSPLFQNCIIGSSYPLYRECIHPRIPQLAILGYADSPAILYSTEMRSKWLAHFLAGNFRLPTISKMEEDVRKWEKFRRNEVKDSYKRSCTSTLQIFCNDQLCRDMGCNPRRKDWFLEELFVAYGPTDYKAVS